MAVALQNPPTSAAAVHFPTVVSKDLNGRELTLPAQLPGDRTLVLVAWQREQQHDIDTWTRGLGLEHSNLPWLELPVIDNPGAFARWFIARGMRGGIKNHDLWQHVVTLYLKKADFNRQIGVSSETAIQALVVDRQGTIVERIIGNYSQAGAAKLRAALQ